MEQLLEAVVLVFLLWRAIVCALIGASIALLLSLLFRSLPPGVWFALTFAGASVGIVWHAGVLSAREAAAGGKPQSISKPIAFISIAVVGGVWGGLLASAVGVPLALMALLLAPTGLGILFCHISGDRFTLNRAAFATIASLVGFSVPYAIGILIG